MKALLTIVIFVLGQGFLVPSLSLGQERPSFEIRQFRFADHKYLKFERLVIEFARQNRTTDQPEIKILPGSASEMTMYLRNFTLIGGIPEAAINDSYVTHSQYLGPISINTDDVSSGVNIRLFLKANVTVDSFWLSNPSRLVLDAFPPSSKRAKGRHVTKMARFYTKRGLASKSGELSNPSNPFDDSVVCFPANTLVVPKISFRLKDGERGLPQESIEWEYVNPNALAKSVCYPKEAQVVASIGFEKRYQQTPPASVGPQAQYYWSKPPEQRAPQNFTPPPMDPTTQNYNPNAAARPMPQNNASLANPAISPPGPAPVSRPSMGSSIGPRPPGGVVMPLPQRRAPASSVQQSPMEPPQQAGSQQRRTRLRGGLLNRKPPNYNLLGSKLPQKGANPAPESN